MNSAPLPQPAAQTCPNCGAAIDGQPQICPNCGASLSVTTANGGCMTIGLQILLGVLALGFGLSGSCFVLVGATGGNDSELGGLAPILIGIGLGIFVLAGLCVWGIIRMAKRRSR